MHVSHRNFRLFLLFATIKLINTINKTIVFIYLNYSLRSDAVSNKKKDAFVGVFAWEQAW
ncbi:MAG: hypothetical protein UW31_C0007G0001 [Candidatus Collierbacteria bacterium GW2011_GWA2_44_13]|nr:MAG: hypothetical protein UW31_C0007G0001 [Candidatus Collierbacteria bacterium GW2011_GWA2_44_13]